VTKGGPLSEFYDSRRTVITDVGALSGFAVGVLVASAFAWRVLATGFRTGALERALFYFLAIALGAGLVGGIVGLGTGRLAGRMWEGRHRRHRPEQEGESETAPTRSAVAPPAHEEFDDGLGLSFRAFGAEVDQFLVLLRRASRQNTGEVRTALNLTRTINIGAYDGVRLVGAVRILTDGHFFHVAELLVDPTYSGRPVEKALRERARKWVGAGLDEDAHSS
jgi:hypothetical protein